MNLDAYWERVEWKPPQTLEPSITHLKKLQLAHLQAFPFENLDVFLTGQVSLLPDRLWNKLVVEKRGGWCFELNGLLHLVLEALGYEVRPLMARNLTGPGKPRTHEVLLVHLDSQLWLVDTGFGGTVLRAPLKLEENQEETQEGLDFKLTKTPQTQGTAPWQAPDFWILHTKKEGAWHPQFGFTLEPWEPQDFSVANHFHVSSPTSSFPQARLVNRIQGKDRFSLVDRIFRRYERTQGEEKKAEETEILSAEDYHRLLTGTFGLPVTSQESQKLFSLDPPPGLRDSGFFSHTHK